MVVEEYKIIKQYIDNYKKDYNVIFSGRDTKTIYPDLDYHFFITADIDKRVEWFNTVERLCLCYNKKERCL